jgi:hypothetical protein
MSRALLLLVWCALAGAACSPAGALCTQKQRCADANDQNGDELDDESVHVCEVAFDARIRALRENTEQECQEQADAELAYASCTAGLDCADFEEPDHNGLCEVERDALDDARRDAEAECTSTD